MQLPFTVVVEPPTWAEFWRALRTWWLGAIVGGLVAAGAAALILSSTSTHDEPQVGGATLQVNSIPPGAAVAIDGRTRGRTPLSLLLDPGEHHVAVHHRETAEATYQVILEAGQTTTIDAELWLRTPRVERLRPVFPGASIVGAGFLRDGRVALTVALPPGDERQLWVVDGDGAVQRLGPPYARGSLAASPDGEQVAYLASIQGAGSTSGRLDEVWLGRRQGERGERRYVLPAAASDERLIDLSWAPAGRHLLIASRQQLPGGGQRARLRWLPVDGGEPAELISLPSEIVAGSYSWSPDGERVAFLTRSGQLSSLCLLGTAEAEFLYLADLSRDDSSPLPFPPLAWSPDGQRLLYAAPTQDRPATGGWLFGPKVTLTLFVADLVRPLGDRLGRAEGQSPAWRRDGSILALARPQSASPLTLRQIAPNGETRDVAELPVKTGSTYAARWDIAQAQALIATRGSTSAGASQADYWLVRFRPEVDR